MFQTAAGWMGNQQLDQDFTLGGQDAAGNQVGGTNFAYNTAQQLWDKGDPMAQRLLRENMMDSTPSMNTMLGVQQATGGSGAIGRMMNLRTEPSTKYNGSRSYENERTRYFKFIKV